MEFFLSGNQIIECKSRVYVRNEVHIDTLYIRILNDNYAFILNPILTYIIATLVTLQ